MREKGKAVGNAVKEGGRGGCMRGEMRTIAAIIYIRVNRVAHYYWLRRTNRAASSANEETAEL